MSDEVAKFYPIPYSLVVENEASIRQKTDFWRLRTIATVLRQTPDQIKSFNDRYSEALNETPKGETVCKSQEV